MQISEVRIKLESANATNDRILGYASIVLDNAFCVRDLRIIEGDTGIFVAMPSRKVMDRCPRCGQKNALQARHCNNCGIRLADDRAARDETGWIKFHVDVAHPINGACRKMISDLVIDAYFSEVRLSKLPGYVCRFNDFGGDDIDTPLAPKAAANARPTAPLAMRSRNPMHAA